MAIQQQHCGHPEDTVEEMAFTSHGSLKVLKDTVDENTPSGPVT